MKDSEEFYTKTKGGNPSGLLRLFFSMNYAKELKGNIAIDLGAGAGNDALYLAEKGFKVTCIDKEEKSKEIILSLKNDNLKFELQEFENLKLNKADLINSCFSLHFCKPDKFKKMMTEITDNINKKGFFIGNFLGQEDEWNGKYQETILDKEELLYYFKNFKIMYFAERKYIKEAILDGTKNWHVFEIIAKKE